MKINAAFSTLQGEAVSIYAVDIDGKLVLAKVGKYSDEKKDGIVIISNNPLNENADVRFRNDEFEPALEAYQTLNAQGLLVMQDDLQRYRPDNVIEAAGMKENGQIKYNIDRMTNGHMAVLAVCLHFFNRLRTDYEFSKVLNAFDRISELNGQSSTESGFFLTI